MEQSALWINIATFAVSAVCWMLVWVAHARQPFPWMRTYLVYHGAYALWLLVLTFSFFRVTYLPPGLPVLDVIVGTVRLVISVVIVWSLPGLPSLIGGEAVARVVRRIRPAATVLLVAPSALGVWFGLTVHSARPAERRLQRLPAGLVGALGGRPSGAAPRNVGAIAAGVRMDLHPLLRLRRRCRDRARHAGRVLADLEHDQCLSVRTSLEPWHGACVLPPPDCPAAGRRDFGSRGLVRPHRPRTRDRRSRAVGEAQQGDRGCLRHRVTNRGDASLQRLPKVRRA